MSTPNTPTDQQGALSAAELRRRLLASTPPPIAASAAMPLAESLEELLAAEDPAQAMPTSSPLPSPHATWNGTATNDLLARLRMPGKSSPVSVPAVRPTAPLSPPPVAFDPNRSLSGRRPPAPTSSIAGRLYGDLTGALNHLNDLSAGNGRYDDSPAAEAQRLRSENKELRTLLDEMKHLLQEASETEQRLVAKDSEFATIVSEKDAQIDELSAQLSAIEEQIARGELIPPPPVPKTRNELEEWGDELERESAKITQDRKKLDNERQQLREDEEALEQQMRQMEVSMARERAMIARQETELKRLSAEIQHELDLLQRGDAGLREQMSKFQRRAQEVLVKPPGGGPPSRR